MRQVAVCIFLVVYGNFLSHIIRKSKRDLLSYTHLTKLLAAHSWECVRKALRVDILYGRMTL